MPPIKVFPQSNTIFYWRESDKTAFCCTVLTEIQIGRQKKNIQVWAQTLGRLSFLHLMFSFLEIKECCFLIFKRHFLFKSCESSQEYCCYHAFEHLEKLLYDQDESAWINPSCYSPPIPWRMYLYSLSHSLCMTIGKWLDFIYASNLCLWK